MFASGTWIERTPPEPGEWRLLESSPRLFPLVRSEFTLPSWVGELRSEECTEIRVLCGKLLSRYAKSECLFIGIGRSPTPIIGYFQETRSAFAMNLPLSRFRNRPGNKVRCSNKVQSARYQALNAAELKALYLHFDRFFLFNSRAWSSKRWLLIDFSQTGDTLVSAFDYLSAYLRHRKVEKGRPNLEILCLVDPRRSAQKIKATLGRRPADLWKVEEHQRLCGGLSMQRYDLASEYKTFTIDDSGKAPVKNEAYQRLRSAIRREMDWDALQKGSSDVA